MHGKVFVYGKPLLSKNGFNEVRGAWGSLFKSPTTCEEPLGRHHYIADEGGALQDPLPEAGFFSCVYEGMLLCYGGA